MAANTVGLLVRSPSSRQVLLSRTKSWRPGDFEVLLLVALRPLRRRHIPHERILRKPKYFTRSGVSSVIAPRRGNRCFVSPCIRQTKPWRAEVSIALNTSPTQVYVALDGVYVSGIHVCVGVSYVRIRGVSLHIRGHDSYVEFGAYTWAWLVHIRGVWSIYVVRTLRVYVGHNLCV